MFVIFLPERGSYVGFFLSLLNKHIFSVGILKKKLSIKKKIQITYSEPPCTCFPQVFFFYMDIDTPLLKERMRIFMTQG